MIAAPEHHDFDLQALAAQCAADHNVPVEQVRVLSVSIYAQAYEGGTNIGEVTLEYATPARAIYGLYTNGTASLFMN